MAFEAEDIEGARAFAATVRFEAELDAEDQKTVRFVMKPEIPKDMKPKIADVIESCADYFQRSIFMGDYEPRTEDGPFPAFVNAIDELNHNLDYFLEELRLLN